MPRRPDLPPLRRRMLRSDPVDQLAEWWARAEAEVPLPHAICLATADEQGRPDARMVLLKGFDRDGFRFYTNYGSAKGRQLAINPHAALVIYWRELDRQVRVRGRVDRLPGAASDAYFATRPRLSQLGAWASEQSAPLADRDELDRRMREAGERFAAGAIPRPPGWGGYVLRHEEVEFWQGQVARLHDRFLYRREGGVWRIQRLAP